MKCKKCGKDYCVCNIKYEYVHSDCERTIKEIQSYKYEKDINDVLNGRKKEVKLLDHEADKWRYFTFTINEDFYWKMWAAREMANDILNRDYPFNQYIVSLDDPRNYKSLCQLLKKEWFR